MLIFIIWAIGLAITGAAILRSLGPIVSTPADITHFREFYFFFYLRHSDCVIRKYKVVAAFRGMHVSPAKHNFGKCDRKV